jgi:hypothetical protein
MVRKLAATATVEKTTATNAITFIEPPPADSLSLLVCF